MMQRETQTLELTLVGVMTLWVTPLKGTQRFGIKGKLVPHYIGPFRILAKRGDVAYQLELPPHLSRVHDVFHVSQLRRCFKDPIREVDHETLDLQDDLLIESTLFVFLIPQS